MTDFTQKQIIQKDLLESLQKRLFIGITNGWTNRRMAETLDIQEQAVSKIISQGSNYSMAIKKLNEILPLAEEFYKKPLINN